MLAFLVRRIAAAIGIVAVVSLVTFLLFFATPGDPGRLACGKVCSPETLQEIHRNLGLDSPILVQYVEFMKGIFAGRDFTEAGDVTHCGFPCFGYSFINHQPVWETLVDRFPATLSLAIGASVIFLVVGVALGMLAALRAGGYLDKGSVAFTLAGASVQIYFIGILARHFFVDRLGWLPEPGYTPLTESPREWFSGLVLPWLVLAFVSIAIYARLTRSAMLEALGEDYIRAGRSRGLSNGSIFIKHAGRATISPVITVFGLDLAGLLGGAIITESVFSIQGVGKLALNSVLAKDLPMIMATVLLSAVIIVLVNLVVDICYAVIDPRVRIT